LKLLLIVVAAAFARPARALDWTPIGYAQALGGFSAFNGDRGSLTGNADALFAPALRVDERWSVLPSLRSSYEGARRVYDVLGTATPAQERMEHKVAARAVWADPASRWRLKPGVSYKAAFLRETKDEAWGGGLFDERLATVGFEAELLTREPHSVRASVDWFTASYPNYTSLESQAALKFQGQPVARELVGDRVLDRDGARLAVAFDAPAGERVRVDAGFSTVWSDYAKQRVVNDAGLLDADTRQDFLSSLQATASMPHEWNADLRALGSMTLGASFLSSSQNGYDATRGVFLRRFYDYRELLARPAVRLLIGAERRPVALDAAVGWRKRTYLNRPPQDGTGAYLGGSLSTTEWTFSSTLTYPLAPRLSLVLTLERASSSSNQRFERFFRYAYEATTVLSGVRWEL
jgi:hypothetical protein